MYIHASLLLLLLPASVLAKGDSQTKGDSQNSTASQCAKVNMLNKLVTLAGNSTKLADVTKNNATKIAEIQAQASTASTTLTTLQSNTTLMSACSVIDAQAATEDDCQQTFMLQRFVAFAANTSAVATATQNNATKIADIQLKASDAAAKLDTLTSNSTLQAACPAVQQKDECEGMDKLEKFVKVANNQTALSDIAKGNATKIQELTAAAAKANQTLIAMQGNATFVSACAALKSDDSEKGTASSTTSASTTSATSKSAAGMGIDAGNLGWTLSTVLVVALGVAVL